MSNQSFAGPMVLPNFVNVQGLSLAYATDTTLTVGIGQVSNSTQGTETGGNFVLSYPAATTINFGTTGFNALDTGTFAANSVYAIYAIGSSTGLLQPGFVASLNVTNTPVMPSPASPALGSYDLIKRIGWWTSNGSTHLYSTLTQSILYHGTRFYQYNTGVTIGVLTLATSLTEQTFVTAPANVIVQFNGTFTPNSGTDTLKMSNVSTSGTGIVISTGGATTAYPVGPFTFLAGHDATTTSLAAVWLIATSASDAATINVTGFYDSL